MQIGITLGQEFDALYNNYASAPERSCFLELEGISRDRLDVGLMSQNYFTKKLSDISINQNANANEGISHNNYLSEITNGLMKINGYYLLWKYANKMYDLRTANKLIRSIWDGDLYFHDPTAIQIPYCWAYSTSFLMTEGRPYGQLESLPPKRADSFLAQVIEMTMDLSSTDFAGAIAIGDLFINYSWYAKKENLDDKAILNDLQKFVHVVNNKFRISAQSPFTNISLYDRNNLNKVWGDYCYPDGTQIDIEYIMRVQKIFGAWFAKGDPKTGLPYRFPVATVNLHIDENKVPTDTDFLDWLCDVNIAKGTFNIYINSGTKVASCCRLTNDTARMEFKADTFGNGGVSLGSHRVVTINMPRIALDSWVKAEDPETETTEIIRDEAKFIRILDYRLEQAKKLLQIHREGILKERIENGGFLKFFKPLQWFSMDRLFSTVGIVGIHEMAFFMGYDIKTPEGQAFVTKVLKHIEKRLEEFSIETGNSFNCEEIPGESAAVLLANKDKIMFGADTQPFALYSNQYLPLSAEASILERIKVSGKFMSILSGGGILHINLADQIKNSAQMKKLVEVSIANGVDHFAINYGFGTCTEKHITVAGNSDTCSICGSKITDYMTRIIGYFTHVSTWNPTRRQEFTQRKFLEDIKEEAA